MTADGRGAGDPGPSQPRADWLPWTFWDEADAAAVAAQRARQERLAAAGAVLGERVFVSPLAAVHCTTLVLGDRSYVAAYAYLTDRIRTGPDCTVNPFCVVRGDVTLGTGVRIGAHASILAFNHGVDPDTPVFRQPITSKGITIGDDVWIGSHAVILDGVTIGDHVVIGAGAVVTRDLPSYAMAAGNPARVLRDRRFAPAAPAVAASGAPAAGAASERDALGDLLADFGARAAADRPAVLARAWDGTGFRDTPGASAANRPWCDAIEIAGAFAAVPDQMPREALIRRLQSMQDPATGLFPDRAGDVSPRAGADLRDHNGLYNVLAVGCALEVLGARPEHPVRAVGPLRGPALVRELDALDWATQAWAAGDWVDGVATAFYFDARSFDLAVPAETLFGWLLLRADPFTGLWGAPTAQQGRLQPVNGFYRLTRGTYAQFGVALPHPVETVDSVLAHARDVRFFGPDRGNACNVLDVLHPLWLCRRQTGHRADEAERWAADQIRRIVARWQPGQGFSFDLETVHPASLQGTEMWLSILWYAADLIGAAERLGYRPRGVHRPEVAWPLGAARRQPEAAGGWIDRIRRRVRQSRS